MAQSHMVRGYGPLDLFLAKQRYKIAMKHIKGANKDGCLLDLGCGSYPLFLITIDFKEKYGLDREVTTSLKKTAKEQGITLIHYDFENEERLPLEDNYFDVVSMLAVFEHINPNELVRIHREIHRVLKPGGMYFMTTPAFWADRLLRFMARLRLITNVEIGEHKDSYRFSKISLVLQEANFSKEKLRFGYFEMFMNTWVTAIK